MAEPLRNGEEPRDREARVLKSVLEAGIVPDNKIGKVQYGNAYRVNKRGIWMQIQHHEYRWLDKFGFTGPHASLSIPALSSRTV